MRKKKIALLMAGIMTAQTLMIGGCGSEAAGSAQLEETGQDAIGQETAEGQDAVQPEETEAAAGEETEEGALAAGQTTDAQEQYEDGANGFAMRLTKTVLSQKQEGENLILSPYSVWLPLAALGNAADEDARQTLYAALGEAGYDAEKLNEEAKSAISQLTCEEQAKWMEENGVEYEKPLKIANALFVDQALKIEPAFEAAFADYFSGKLFEVDFADDSAVQEVNDWASEQTDGRIEHIIDGFDPQTVAAIANAIYFSDSWTDAFPKSATQNNVFYGKAGEQEVPFMNNEFTSIPYFEDDTLQAAVLSTANGGQLVLLLPKEGQTAEGILEGMDAERLETLLGSESKTVQLSLPKFKIESETFSLKRALELMGIPLFDTENAHLTELAEGEELFLSDAVQKAMLEVDEEGMTAAAVTVAMIERMSLEIPQEPVEMKCDRPFAFVLTAYAGEGQQVLFTGVLNQMEQ